MQTADGYRPFDSVRSVSQSQQRSSVGGPCRHIVRQRHEAAVIGNQIPMSIVVSDGDRVIDRHRLGFAN